MWPIVAALWNGTHGLTHDAQNFWEMLDLTTRLDQRQVLLGYVESMV